MSQSSDPTDSRIPALRDLVAAAKSTEWTEEQVAKQATLWRAHHPREGARALLPLLSRDPRETTATNTLRLLALLYTTDEQWAKLTARAMRGRGRVPKPFREKLRLEIQRLRRNQPPSELEYLTSPLFTATSPPTPKRERSRPGTPNTGGRAILLDTESSKIEGVPRTLLDSIANSRPFMAGFALHKRAFEIDTDRAEHIYISGLAACGVYIRRNNGRADLINTEARTKEYIRRCGFFEFIQGKDTSPYLSSSRETGTIPLLQINSRESADETAAGFVAICRTHGILTEQSESPFLVLVAELIENVLRHAGTASVTCVSAQRYGKRNKITLAIVDTGIGIRQSFVQGRNESVKRSISTDSEALEAAIRPLVTSKPVVEGIAQGHAGYGLYVASEVVTRNGGTFSLTSGAATIQSYRRQGQQKQSLYSHAPWQGCILQAILDLDQAIPLQEVYRTLPPPLGYEEEDFFDPI